MSTPQGRTRPRKVALGVGFAALLLGVLAAYTSPATGYELSMFAQTPVAYFFGLAVALLVSVWLSFRIIDAPWLSRAALLLGGLSVTSVVALPLVRGYYLYGGGDSLTHLGWTRELLEGTLEPTGLLYPGIHMMTIFVTEVTGLRLGRSQMHVALAFILVFVIFVALTVRVLAGRKWAVPVGLFAGLLLLPVNNVSVHVQAHPLTQSLLFVPFALYLVVLYAVGDGEQTNPLGIGSQTGVLLTLAAAALIFVHPQGALNLILVLAAIAGVQFLARHTRLGEAIDQHRPVYVPTVVAVAVFALWAPRFERVWNAAAGVVNRLLYGAAPANEITQRAASLTDVGGSIGTLFVKLFGIAFLFCLLAGAVILVWSTGRLDNRFPERNGLLGYLVVALVPLGAGFAVFFLSSSNTMHFRYLGFIMVPVTILGALALAEGADALTSRFSSRQIRAGLAVFFLVLMPLALATVHSTPYIYKPTGDITEMRYEGIDSTVEQMDRDIAFAGIRAPPDRLVDASQGTERAERLALGGTTIPGPVFGTNLTSYYDSPRYVPVDRSDYLREVVLYEELRYSADGFEELSTDPALSRVKSTGEFRLYLLDNGTAG
jgi:hypothetical protein